MLFEQQPTDDIDQLFVIIAVNVCTDDRPDLFRHFIDRGSRFLRCRALGCDAQTALTLLGVGRQRRICLSVNQRQEDCFQAGFSNAEHAQHTVINHAVLSLLQQRLDLQLEHSRHFARRSRHRDDQFAVLLQRKTAVPASFGNPIAREGMYACLRLFGVIVRPARA